MSFYEELASYGKPSAEQFKKHMSTWAESAFHQLQIPADKWKAKDFTMINPDLRPGEKLSDPLMSSLIEGDGYYRCAYIVTLQNGAVPEGSVEFAGVLCKPGEYPIEEIKNALRAMTKGAG